MGNGEIPAGCGETPRWSKVSVVGGRLLYYVDVLKSSLSQFRAQARHGPNQGARGLCLYRVPSVLRAEPALASTVGSVQVGRADNDSNGREAPPR